LSSNIYHLPTIDESEEEGDNDMKEEKVEDGERGCELEKEPDERTAREEEEEYILKGEVRCEELSLSVTSGSVAPQVFCCAHCNKPFSSKSAAKNHRRRNCKGVEVAPENTQQPADRSGPDTSTPVKRRLPDIDRKVEGESEAKISRPDEASCAQCRAKSSPSSSRYNNRE